MGDDGFFSKFWGWVAPPPRIEPARYSPWQRSFKFRNKRRNPGAFGSPKLTMRAVYR